MLLQSLRHQWNGLYFLVLSSSAKAVISRGHTIMLGASSHSSKLNSIVINRRCVSQYSTPATTVISKDLNFYFNKKNLPVPIRWSLLVIFATPVVYYVRVQNRRVRIIEERDREVSDYVFVDLAKGNRYVGRMLIGVFGNAVPMTVNNFIHLAEGYQVKDKVIGYRNTKIHAVIPGKMVLGGDVVTGEGANSLSIYGPYFPDENFSQPFLKRGDIAMFSHKLNCNGSQFMITLRNYREGNGRYVVFGTLIKGHELLRMLVADVNPNSKAWDHSKSVEPVEIVNCGLYTDLSQGPPHYISDKHQKTERKLSYSTGHAWQPMTEVWEMRKASFRTAERDLLTGGRFTRELFEEFRSEIKQYLDDQRKWEYLNAAPDKRQELHASVHREEYRRSDLTFRKRMAYQQQQKLMEGKMKANALAVAEGQ